MALAAAFIVALLLLRFTAQGQYLALKANQYVELNLPKNTGLRHYGLTLIKATLGIVPSPPLLHYDRTQLDVGFTLNTLDVLASEAAIQRTAYNVDNVNQLQSLLKTVPPGATIWLAPGDYKITKRLGLGTNGSRDNPILLGAKRSGSVRMLIDTTEGIYVDKSFWIIRNLIFQGVCKSHPQCEHAIHFYGDADNVIIHNNQFINFNAAIKANGHYAKKRNAFADNVTISNNDFYNTELRHTSTPSSPIDVVGGDNWLVTENYIADFARKNTGRVSVTYGAFLKGGGNNGIFEKNVVNCAADLAYQSHLDVRIGLSLGNGGTDKKFCQSQHCDTEHNGGKIRQNVILNCINDVGVYLNKAAGTVISGNTILNSLGIDARFPQTSVSIIDNQYQGRIRSRDGAFVSQRNNQKVEN